LGGARQGLQSRPPRGGLLLLIGRFGALTLWWSRSGPSASRSPPVIGRGTMIFSAQFLNIFRGRGAVIVALVGLCATRIHAQECPRADRVPDLSPNPAPCWMEGTEVLAYPYATGTEPLSYQWRLNEVALHDDGRVSG